MLSECLIQSNLRYIKLCANRDQPGTNIQELYSGPELTNISEVCHGWGQD